MMKIEILTENKKQDIILKYDLTISNDININDIDEEVTCRICGKQYKRIYGRHLRYVHNKITAKEYRSIFNNAPISCKKDRKSTSKNSGKHMKTEKYKKMFSEMFKGDKNPNHKSKTTKAVRQSNSPFSIEFYNLRYPELDLTQREDILHKFVKNALKDRISDTTLEYYLNQGMSHEEAKESLKKRQTTFTKKICIEKYGEKSGIEIWMDRQERWIDSLNKNGKLKVGYSEISQTLFREIEKEMNENNFMYGEKNGELKIKSTCNTKWYMYDFTDIKRKKIIEYNGDLYHANPKLYEPDDYPHPFRKDIKSSEIWGNDYKKINTAEEEGYDVLIVWESEYNHKSKEIIKNEIINKCINFLLNEGEFSKI